MRARKRRQPGRVCSGWAGCPCHLCEYLAKTVADCAIKIRHVGKGPIRRNGYSLGRYSNGHSGDYSVGRAVYDRDSVICRVRHIKSGLSEDRAYAEDNKTQRDGYYLNRCAKNELGKFVSEVSHTFSLVEGREFLQLSAQLMNRLRLFRSRFDQVGNNSNGD